MSTWAAEEFAGAVLGDARLNKRLIKLAARFADKPTASIPGACPDWDLRSKHPFVSNALSESTTECHWGLPPFCRRLWLNSASSVQFDVWFLSNFQFLPAAPTSCFRMTICVNCR